MSAARCPSSSRLIVKPPRRQADARHVIASAVESLERRRCLSVSFSGPVNWSADDGPVSVAVADFNGDDKHDLVVAHDTADQVSILIGYGSGGSSNGGSFPTGVGPVSIAVGDYYHASVALGGAERRSR